MRMDKHYYERLSEGRVLPEEIVKKTVELFINEKGNEEMSKEFDIEEIEKMIPGFETSIKSNI